MTSSPEDPAHPRVLPAPAGVGGPAPGRTDSSGPAWLQRLTAHDVVLTAAGQPACVVVRTTDGWAVVTPGRSDGAADLVEALCLADLVVEDLGARPGPSREARRAARGATAEVHDDPRDQQIAVQQRTIDQLEHALATRVATERAIGALAVQRSLCPREAFEDLRHRARSAGRAVHELAREVLDGLTACQPDAAEGKH